MAEQNQCLTFLTIGGIAGSTSDSLYEGQGAMEISNFSMDLQATAASVTSQGNDGPFGTLNVGTISFSKGTDGSFGALQKCCMVGANFQTASIEYVRFAGPVNNIKKEQWIVFNLTGVQVQNYQVSISADRPSESITIAFAAFKALYYVFDKNNKKTGKSYSVEYNFQTKRPSLKD